MYMIKIHYILILNSQTINTIYYFLKLQKYAYKYPDSFIEEISPVYSNCFEKRIYTSVSVSSCCFVFFVFFFFFHLYHGGQGTCAVGTWKVCGWRNPSGTQ